MLSAWRKTYHLYLGQGLTLLSIGRGNTQVMQHSLTMPIDRILNTTATSLPNRSRLKITVSSALCPAVSFAAPEGVRTWSELRQVALAAAAAQLDLPPTEVACELENAGLAAAMPRALLQGLQMWAASNRFAVTSVQPLWGVASQASSSKRRDVLAMVIEEPDAITMLANAPLHVQAATISRVADDAELDHLKKRWLAGIKVAEDKAVLRVRLTAERQVEDPDMPSPWRCHWSVQ